MSIAILGLAGCAKRVEPFRDGSADEGYASWYGSQFDGKKTASGEVYNMRDRTAAHRRAPFGTQVKVTNLSNGRSTLVRINDRGPFVKGRIIDLSLTAAQDIGLVAEGTAKVRLAFLGYSSSQGSFFVQAGAFREEENARRQLAELRSRFPQNPTEIRTSDNLHRIWVGPFEEESQAVQAVKTIRGAGFDALILRR
ncbi:MAG TPA: septal ring lytic transglycosylase RlpA family protein [Bdellovibrionota bacterium]|nr:septal ring lytic transglycosylase RlpA family protein [Bdellovibrionota bacterium]